MIFSAIASQSGRSEASAVWLNRAYAATDSPLYLSLLTIAGSDFESSNCRLFEALVEKLTSVPLLQDILDHAMDFQTSRREQGQGTSVLFLIRLVWEKISPAGAQAGQRSRPIQIINKLEIQGPRSLTWNHFW